MEYLPKKKRKARKCSYCIETGHDRRTCNDLSLDRAKFAKINRAYLQLVQDDIEEQGIGAGALVEYIQTQNGKKKTTALAIITQFSWKDLFFRKPGKRWIEVHVLGEHSVVGGSYGYIRGKRWRIRFPQHELKKEWCDDGHRFKYRGELKKMSESQYLELGAGASGGYWKVASPVRVSYAQLTKNRPFDFMQGWYGVKEHFADLSQLGGQRECRSID